MNKVVVFQMSLFGSFVNIQPNQDITMKLMADLVDENMIPGTVSVSSIDPINKKVETETRLQMLSQDRTWKIVFLPNRIDVDYDYMGGENYYSDLSDIYNKGIELLRKTSSTFKDTTGNRLAVNTRIILPALSSDEENEFIHRFTVPISTFNDSRLDEWNVHYNVKKGLKVTDSIFEICNNIVDMGNIVVFDGLGRRMAIGLDVNTEPENSSMRFKYTDLISFAHEAEIEMKAVLKAIEEE